MILSGKTIVKLLFVMVIIFGVFLACDNNNDSSNNTQESATLVVQNNTSYTIYWLYVSPSSDDSWGQDQLGSNVISPGSSFRLVGIVPGTYDIRAEVSDRSLYWQKFGISFSAGATVTFNCN